MMFLLHVDYRAPGPGFGTWVAERQGGLGEALPGTAPAPAGFAGLLPGADVPPAESRESSRIPGAPKKTRATKARVAVGEGEGEAPLRLPWLDYFCTDLVQ
jgi:hypothetical protein